MRRRGTEEDAGMILALAVVFVILLVALIWAIGTAIVFYGFNLVLAPIFGWPELSAVQAWLLMLLISFIGGAFKATVSWNSSDRS